MRKKIAYKDLRAYYDCIFYSADRVESNSFRSDKSYDVCLDYLSVEMGNGKSLLDVSCGTGKLLKMAEQRKMSPHGIDFSLKAIEKAKDVAQKSNLVVGMAEHLPYKDRLFDYITCLGSLEHYRYPETALNQMIRVSKDNGRLCILVPNSYYLFDVINVWRRGQRRVKAEQPLERTATIVEWRNFFEKKGLKTLKVYQDLAPIDTSWKHVFSDANPRRIINRFVEKLLQFLMPLNLSYQFVFILRKKAF